MNTITLLHKYMQSIHTLYKCLFIFYLKNTSLHHVIKKYAEYASKPKDIKDKVI